MVLGTVQAAIEMGSLLLGLSEQQAMLSPALHISGVHREVVPIADLAFIFSSLDFVVWPHSSVSVQEKASFTRQPHHGSDHTA